VVLGVIAVFVAVQLPARAVARGQTKIAQCAGNLRQIGLASQIYANENNNRLPLLVGSATWVWDVPATAANGLLKYGPVKSTFYCPGTAPRFTDLQNWQDVSAPERNLWDFGDGDGINGGFHVIGYSLAFSGSASRLSSTNQNTTMLAESIQYQAGFLPAPVPSARVLAADATISESSSDHQGPAVNSYDFNQVFGGFYLPQVSPHLNGSIPAGGNVGFKDGHVAWRNFQAMDERAAATSAGFWW